MLPDLPKAAENRGHAKEKRTGEAPLIVCFSNGLINKISSLPQPLPIPVLCDACWKQTGIFLPRYLFVLTFAHAN